MVKTEIVEQARVMPVPTILERRDRILEFLGSSNSSLSRGVGLAGAMTEEKFNNKAALLALTGTEADSEVHRLLAFLREDGLIEGTDVIHLTFRGWRYVEEQRAKQVASVQAFVAMWFHTTMVDAYTRGFERAIRDTGYEPMRIDRKEHINKIDDEIIAEIRRSRFLVADFTSEPDRPRGGVYFEAGFAFGVSIPVIWTCREDLISHVHFDTRQFNHIVWNNPDDLYAKLKNRIGAVIGDGPLSQ